MKDAFFWPGAGGSVGTVKKSTIVVTFPVGADCVVSNGTKAYRALDKSGTAAFIVDPGTWNVSATLGSDYASENTTVEAGGWAEVGLAFGIVLYRAGMTDGTTALAWQSEASQIALAPSITYDSDALLVYYDLSIGGRTGVVHWEPCDLTDYSTVEVELTMDGIWTSAYQTANGLFVWTALSSGYYAAKAVAKHQISSNDETLLTVDVSALTGVHYVGMGLRRGDTAPTYRITSAIIKK